MRTRAPGRAQSLDVWQTAVGLMLTACPESLFMNRPARRNSASIVDLAPTIFNYFAVPVPENIDGTGLLNNGVIFS
jgi:hypothetical protein